jgi:hypothetical protein
MKLRRREDPGHQEHEVAAIPPTEPAPVLRLLVSSNTDLSEQDFSAQKDMIRRVATFDSATHLWHAQISPDRPEWAAEVLSTLFKAARVHGTAVQVQPPPAPVKPTSPGDNP